MVIISSSVNGPTSWPWRDTLYFIKKPRPCCSTNVGLYGLWLKTPYAKTSRIPDGCMCLRRCPRSCGKVSNWSSVGGKQFDDLGKIWLYSDGDVTRRSLGHGL